MFCFDMQMYIKKRVRAILCSVMSMCAVGGGLCGRVASGIGDGWRRGLAAGGGAGDGGGC